MSCDGCKLTFEIQGSVLVRPGAIVSGTILSTPLGSGNGSFNTSIPAPAPTGHSGGPSGCQWIIYHPSDDEAILFDEILLSGENGLCVVNSANGNCEQEKPCKFYDIRFPVPPDMLDNGDLVYRINGEADINEALEQPFASEDGEGIDGFTIPGGGPIPCDDSVTTIEIAFVPNGTGGAPPVGYPNWATGMKITAKCSKCGGEEEPQ